MLDRRPLIDARGLAVGYRGGPPVLQDVTFAVAPGERIGVLGPNGGGKTTLMRALLGELAPRAGSLAVTGRAGPCRRPSVRGWTSRCPRSRSC